MGEGAGVFMLGEDTMRGIIAAVIALGTASHPLVFAETVAGTAVNTNRQCNGWGLTVPLFGVSNRRFLNDTVVRRNKLHITGPVETGIGGGYFGAWSHDAACKEYVFGWEIFGFSEGLNPDDKFQIGVASGVALHAWDKFSFGVALGLDLVRREKYIRDGRETVRSNGVLGGVDFKSRAFFNSFTVLFTFSLASSAGGAEQ